MSDLPNGAAAAAPESDAAPAAPESAPVTDREVANVLVGLLDGDDVESDSPGSLAADEPSDETAPDESPASGDDDAGEPEADADGRPPIEAPAGWNGKDRETWQTLPPAVQETIRRRDSEMAGAVYRATQERAEVERIATARLEQATQDRQQYVQNLSVFRQVMLPQAQEFANINWVQLSSENPAEYVRKSAEFNAMQQHFSWINNEVQRVQQQHGQELAQQKEQAKRFAHARLVEAMPEFADPQKAQEIGSRLGQFLRTQGFQDQEIIDCIDDRAIRLALKAMSAEEQTSNVAKANAKRTPPPAPQVQRPGSSRVASNSNRMTQLASRFEQQPSVENAARIVAQWLQ